MQDGKIVTPIDSNCCIVITDTFLDVLLGSIILTVSCHGLLWHPFRYIDLVAQCDFGVFFIFKISMHTVIALFHLKLTRC